MAQVEVTSEFKGKAGDNYLARVSFAYECSRMVPVVIEHQYEKTGNDVGKYATAEDAHVVGATHVIIKNAFLKQSERTGNLYLQISGVKVPFDVQQQVIAACNERLSAA